MTEEINRHGKNHKGIVYEYRQMIITSRTNLLERRTDMMDASFNTMY